MSHGQGQGQGKHTFVGPGGSLREPSHMGLAKGGGAGVGGGGAGGGGMAINKPDKGKGLSGAAGSPLTSSVQENFRGFTYTGESLMVSCWVGVCGAWDLFLMR